MANVTKWLFLSLWETLRRLFSLPEKQSLRKKLFLSKTYG